MEKIVKTFKPVSSLESGDILDSCCYMLKNAAVKTGKNGRNYLDGQITDKDSAIDIRMWDYVGPIDQNEIGSIVCVSGTVGEYQNIPQLMLSAIRAALPMDKYKAEDLVPAAPIDAEAEMKFIADLVSKMTDPDYKAISEAVMNQYGNKLKDIPAGKSIHHAFLHGLLMHTANMMRLADTMAPMYEVNHDLVVLGTLCHDIAKIYEYNLSPLGVVNDYSIQGQLLGHLVMGAQIVKSITTKLNTPKEKALVLQHMMLSHHGKPEYGAAVMPQTAEAILLSQIDLLDSRMEIVREQLQNVEPGSSTDRIPALDGQKLYKPVV